MIYYFVIENFIEQDQTWCEYSHIRNCDNDYLKDNHEDVDVSLTWIDAVNTFAIWFFCSSFIVSSDQLMASCFTSIINWLSCRFNSSLKLTDNRKSRRFSIRAIRQLVITCHWRSWSRRCKREREQLSSLFNNKRNRTWLFIKTWSSWWWRSNFCFSLVIWKKRVAQSLFEELEVSSTEHCWYDFAKFNLSAFLCDRRLAQKFRRFFLIAFFDCRLRVRTFRLRDWVLKRVECIVYIYMWN